MFKKYFSVVFLLALLASFGSASATFAQNNEQQFIVSVDNVADFAYVDSGVFNTAAGASGPGPAMPGQAYEWELHGGPGHSLSFATMLVQSNDWFFAPDERGVPLFRADGTPMSGDVTRYVKLWDVGTEGDQPPGSGPDQAPRQAAPDTGPADPNNKVRQVLSDEVPTVNELINVTLTPIGDNHFRLRIENVSGDSSLPGPISPGVAVVHNRPAPLFVRGMPDFGRGLEAIAEDGDPSALGAALAAETGTNTPLSPVFWAIHTQPNLLFATGQAASAGLERVAEEGNTAPLASAFGDDLQSGVAAVGRGASGPGPIAGPHGNYTFMITASPGDQLSLATMFGQSNDWFYGLHAQPLFDQNGNPISGNFSHMVRLYDAGTEVDEAPGFGPNQAPRQPAPDTGADENAAVHPVSQAGFADAGDVLHLTITPVE